MKAADLGLIGPALDAAMSVEAKFPGAVFTSGRRGVADQARAMSQNIFGNSHWIAQTYKASASSAELQSWVSLNLKSSMAQIEAGLAVIMSAWSDDQKRALSKHFSGEAFDVRPCADLDLLAFLENMPGMKFLAHEGGLVRWHAQAI